MGLKNRIYLYTKECQRLMSNQSVGNNGNLINKIDRKFSHLWALAKDDNLSAILHVNIICQRLHHYISDITSELKKYQIALDNIDTTQMLLKTTMVTFTRRGYTICHHNSLVILLEEALQLTDQFIVLIVTLHRTGKSFDNRTMLTVKGRVQKTLYRVLGKINQISIKNIDPIKGNDYFRSPEFYQQFNQKKVRNILNIGAIKKYREVR